MRSQKIMIVDTELDGHHVLWLCLTAKVMLANGCSVILVVNQKLDVVMERMRQIDAALPDKLTVITSAKKFSVRDYFEEIFRIFISTRADRILFNNFDTIASGLSRLVVLGYRPPRELSGKVAVIYHRPRPLDDSQKGLGVGWKRLGMNKLLKEGFFHRIFLLDRSLVTKLAGNYPDRGIAVYLPDPWIDDGSPKQIPPEYDVVDRNCKLLQYGVGDKRKGTHLLLKSLSNINRDIRLTTIIAGRQSSPKIKQEVEKSRHRIILIDRFISNAEEKFLFDICDFIAVPYLSHYGSSNILSKAAHYRKPVLASDFHLIGQTVRENRLGVVFKDNSIEDLADKIYCLNNENCRIYRRHLEEYSHRCSFDAFSKSLQKML